MNCCYCIVLWNILIHPTRLITMDCDKLVYTSSRQPCWNLAGTFLGTLLEPCVNLAGTFLEPSSDLAGTFLAATLLEPAGTFLRTLLQLPNSYPVGFQSLGRGVVPAKCMLWHYWNLARTSLKYCWNIARLLEWWKLVKPCWNLGGKSLQSCWNCGRTVLEPSWKLGETWNLAGKSLEHCWNSAGTWWTLAGTWWNLAGTLLLEPLAGTVCWESMRVSICFFFLHCFLLCLMCRVVRLEVWLEFCWNCFATLLAPIRGQLLNSWRCFFWRRRELKTRIHCWNCDAGILAWTFEETFAGTLAWTLLSRVPRLQGQGAKFQACTQIPRMQISKVLGFIQD